MKRTMNHEIKKSEKASGLANDVSQYLLPWKRGESGEWEKMPNVSEKEPMAEEHCTATYWG